VQKRAWRVKLATGHKRDGRGFELTRGDDAEKVGYRACKDRARTVDLTACKNRALTVDSTLMGLRRGEGETGEGCLTLRDPVSYFTSSHILHIPAQQSEVKEAKVSHDGNN
jgi:hypothetical protein